MFDIHLPSKHLILNFDCVIYPDGKIAVLPEFPLPLSVLDIIRVPPDLFDFYACLA